MIMLTYWGLPLSMFIMALFSFISNRKHLLSMLMNLEYIMLSLFYMLFMLLSYFMYESYFSMIFLVFSICEGALGLPILVSMIRTNGKDYFQSMIPLCFMRNMFWMVQNTLYLITFFM